MERLAEAVATRKQDLQLTQEAMRDNGGPSVPTISRILDATGPKPSRVTFTKLDRALQWQEGSAQLVWDHGAEPVLADRLADVDEQREIFNQLTHRKNVAVVQMTQVLHIANLSLQIATLVAQMDDAPEELTEAVEELHRAGYDLFGSAVASTKGDDVLRHIIETLSGE